MFITNGQFIGHTSAIYRNGIASYPFRTKDIQLSVICAHMVDFCRPGHCMLSITN